MITSLIRYVTDHWLGRHSLAWSFWVNLVLLRLVIFLGQMWLRPSSGEDYSGQQPIVLATAILFHAVIFVWQVVGVLRAGEAHIQKRGSVANAWGAQAGILVAFWITATFAFEAWQATLPVSVEDDRAERVRLQHEESYRIDVSSDRQSISIDGAIALGITRRFSRLLKQNPGLQFVILTSDGGNIFEARGLAKLIRTNGLGTHVESYCDSACTTAFIGGHHRTLVKDARLGFHQYRIDADYLVYGADTESEQLQDRASYAERGVKSWFLDKMFSLPADQIWIPTPEELLSAGVVNEITKSP